jgi:hypothetical protein
MHYCCPRSLLSNDDMPLLLQRKGLVKSVKIRNTRGGYSLHNVDLYRNVTRILLQIHAYQCSNNEHKTNICVHIIFTNACEILQMGRSSEASHPAYSPHQISNCAGYQLRISSINTGPSVTVPHASWGQTSTSGAAQFAGCALRCIFFKKEARIIDK